jgi:hypothetical protein
MTRCSRRTATQGLAAVLGVAHLALVVTPDEVARAVSPGAAAPPRWLVRLLGIRVVLQQLVVLTAPTRRIVLGGVVVDGLHAASMVAAARNWPQYRRVAVASAGAAVTSAGLGLATAPTA